MRVLWSRKIALMISLALFVTWGARAAEDLPKTRIGEKMANFSLPDVNGKMHSLYRFKRQKAVVIIFIATKCPSSNAFNQVMAKLAREYAKRRATIIGIDSNKNDTVAELAEHARAHELSFLVLKDEGNRVADQLGASVTPEVFLLDRKWTLRYQGALGNSHKPTTKPEQATDNEIRPALDAVLAGKPVAQAETKPFG